MITRNPKVRMLMRWGRDFLNALDLLKFVIPTALGTVIKKETSRKNLRQTLEIRRENGQKSLVKILKIAARTPQWLYLTEVTMRTPLLTIGLCSAMIRHHGFKSFRLKCQYYSMASLL